MTTEVQAVVFINNAERKWTPSKSMAWIKSHGFEPIKEVDKVWDGRRISQYRYRMIDPSVFKSFTTKVLPKNIHLVLGVRR